MPKILRRPLLTSILIALVVAVTSPAELFLANVNETAYGLSYHSRWAVTLFCAIAGSLFGLAVLAFLLNKRVFQILDVLLGVILVTMLVNRDFLYSNYGAFDGRGLDIDPYSTLFTVQLAIAATLIIIAWLYRSILDILIPAAGVYVAINLAVAISNFYASENSWEALAKHPFPVDQAYFQFSTTEPNFLYILLDEVYGGSALEVFQSDRSLAGSFAGFTFYSDTAGAYPTTIVSVPAILGGKLYGNDESIRDYLSNSFAESDLMQLIQAKQMPAFVHSSGMYCRYLGQVNCSDMGDMLPSQKAADQEYGELLDIALFKMAPEIVKPLLYNNGNWTMQGLIKRSGPLQNTSFQVQEFRYFINEIVAAPGASSFKFYHNTVTHSPVNHNSNCHALSVNLIPRYENYLKQDRCGFSLVENLLDKLRELGIYDNTFIVISSDHGRPFVPDKLQDRFDASSGGATHKHYGYAHAMLMVKPLNAMDELQFSAQPMSLLDASPIIAAGMSSGSTEVTRFYPPGKRPFHYYSWSKKYFDWKQPFLPAFEAIYSIEAGIDDPDSWKENVGEMQSVLERELQQSLPCGRAIDFSQENDNRYYASKGLSTTEIWGRWSDGISVSIYFKGAQNACANQRINMQLKAYLRKDKPSQFAEVFFNNKKVGEISFGRETARRAQIELAFEAKNYRESAINTIELRIADPVSPASLGESNDPRKLAIGFESLSIH